METVNLSLLPRWAAEVLSPWCSEAPVRVDNPLSEEYAYLRRSLLASLLRVQGTNERIGEEELHLFEVAPVYWADPTSRTGCREERHLAVLTTGGLFEAKGFLESALESLSLEVEWREAEVEGLEGGLTLELLVGGESLGVLGEVSDAMVERFELRRPAVVSEVKLEPVAERAELIRRLSPLARYPAVERELSVVVEEAVRWGDVEAAIESLDIAILESVGPPQEPYRGAQVGAGKKSITFALVFRSTERTLSNEEATAQVSRIVATLSDRLGAQLRVQ